MLYCPLCRSSSQFFSKDRKREYYKCIECDFIFVPVEFHLTVKDEIERYKLHTNSAEDSRYREFLNRIVPTITRRVTEGSKGVDFGCGPSPILPQLLKNESIETIPYDPIFFQSETTLNTKWDFIVSTEVFEHFNTPSRSIKEIWELIKSEGYLFIMTQLYSEDIEFKSWYYKGDPTHIGFYTRKTFEIIAKYLGAQLELEDKDIIILRKV